MMISEKLFSKIKAHIIACYPEEACGIIVENEFIPTKNTHATPLKDFKIAGEEIIPFLGRIQGVIHSHCRSPRMPEIFDLRTPSFADMMGQKVSKVPWYIFGTDGTSVTTPIKLPRDRSNIYVLRPFIWFINDCYTLVQDYYYFEFGIELPDAVYDKDFSELRKFDNLFEEHIANFGFIEISPIRHKYKNGDLVLLDNAGFNKNHLGIYENGYIIHQDTLSKKELAEHFVDRIHVVLRHESQNI